MNIPHEYLELVLCRDVYHCDPVTLNRVPLTKILNHLTCLDVEGKVKEAWRKRKK